MSDGPIDLTRPNASENVHDDDEGTGIYWLIDKAGKREQIFVPGVTRQRAQDLAGELGTIDNWKADAYRWVPDQVEDSVSLISSKCGGQCTKDLDCINNACRCISGRCKRK